MQVHGYILDENKEKVKILVRSGKYGKYLKLRKTGKDGSHFIDEEFYLNEFTDTLQKLKNGEVVYC